MSEANDVDVLVMRRCSNCQYMAITDIPYRTNGSTMKCAHPDCLGYIDDGRAVICGWFSVARLAKEASKAIRNLKTEEDE